MATKKAASSKKSVKSKVTTSTDSKTTEKKPTHVTSVKAVTVEATKRRKTMKFGQMRSPIIAACIAEFIGTFILAMVAVLTRGEPLYVGFALIGIVLMIGTLSGSHVNPLVTAGAWMTRKVSGKRALFYIAAQILGAMLALVVATQFANGAPTPDAANPMMQMQQTPSEVFKVNQGGIDDSVIWYAFFGEMLGAAIFGFFVSSAMRERRDRMAQAATVGFGLMVALIITGFSMQFIQAGAIVNPAIAVTLSAIDWANLNESLMSIVIYMGAPLIGGVVGFFLHDILRGEYDEDNNTVTTKEA